MATASEKNRIRPIYNALQGFLKEAAQIKATTDSFHDDEQWKYVNDTIDELIHVTSGTETYTRFKIVPHTYYANNRQLQRVMVSVFRGQLAGIINYLHGIYFSEEPAPSSGNPSMVIHQNQSQQQSMAVTLLDLQDKINQQIQKSEDENEKSFLEKVKSELSTATSFMQLLQLIFSTAHQFGIDTSKLHSFFT